MASLRPVAQSFGLVDRPGGRKRHLGEVPVVGGLAMFIGTYASLPLVPLEHYAVLPSFIASAILVFVGAIDDRFHIPAAPRLAAQIAAILLMVNGAGLSVVSIGDPFGTGEILLGPIALIFTVLVGLTMINAMNLIDGIDGLAGSMALVGLVAIAAVKGVHQDTAIVSFVVIAAIVGFLIFNFPTIWNRKARSFMGDAGSTLLGFTLMWVTLGITQGDQRVISPVHCLWFASIPIYDLLTCFVIRLRKGKSPFVPGRDHFHHTLRRGGFGVRQTLGILTLLQMVYAFGAVAAHFAGVPDVVMFVAWSAVGLSQKSVIRLIARRHRAQRIHNLHTL
jgi:UDP-GlcNAc:undecaprenyl-phosphate GlcNAc-1-phosphate transferase